MTMTNDIIDDALADGRKPHPGRRMTEEEFVEWCTEKTRAEWVDGEVILMSPVNRAHGRLNIWLIQVLGRYVEHHDLGEILGPETQIRLPAPTQRREPAILFIPKARSAIVRPTYVDGPPDLIIELVSPESVARDWREKYSAYQASGVREYWVIDPMAERADFYVLRDEKYQLINPVEGAVRSEVLPGFYIRPEWLWQDPLPKVAGIIKELGVAL